MIAKFGRRETVDGRRMKRFGRRKMVGGRRLKNGLLVVILRSPPQADDEESQRDVKQAA